MTEEKLVQLRAFTRKKLLITCNDGELLQVRLLHIDDERRDAVCELLHIEATKASSKERHLHRGNLGRDC